MIALTKFLLKHNSFYASQDYTQFYLYNYISFYPKINFDAKLHHFFDLIIIQTTLKLKEPLCDGYRIQNITNVISLTIFFLIIIRRCGYFISTTHRHQCVITLNIIHLFFFHLKLNDVSFVKLNFDVYIIHVWRWNTSSNTSKRSKVYLLWEINLRLQTFQVDKVFTQLLLN